MNQKRLEKPEPYCPEFLPSNKRCNGTALVIGDRVDVELFRDGAKSLRETAECLETLGIKPSPKKMA